VYNVDKTGALIGTAAKSNVVTSTNVKVRAAVVHPDGRERVTVIKCVSTSSWCLPLFRILSGKIYNAILYKDLLVFSSDIFC
jgi:hypothetical protein